jgi:hypothetical protein
MVEDGFSLIHLNYLLHGLTLRVACMSGPQLANVSRATCIGTSSTSGPSYLVHSFVSY